MDFESKAKLKYVKKDTRRKVLLNHSFRPLKSNTSLNTSSNRSNKDVNRTGIFCIISLVYFLNAYTLTDCYAKFDLYVFS